MNFQNTGKRDRNTEGDGESMEQFDLVIIGGGPAGLAAADSAKDSGCQKILILERDNELGGILNQCIHNGFGLHRFKEELTGPEYAARFITRILEKEIEYRLHTMVMHVSPEKKITAMSREKGMYEIQATSIILAMGCRERPRGALNIPGFRPAGIFSAGTAQRLVNMEGYLPGKEVVILGSGDIGLIMARRMTLEGAKVRVVAELLPFSGGLKRNIVQCLDDFEIPLKLRTTVIEIHGKERIQGVTLAQVDEEGKPILATQEFVSCDTLLLSVGLIPENEVTIEMGIHMERATGGARVNESLETNLPGVFACGNVLHVHDLVDYVSEEAALAGRCAAKYVLEREKRIQTEEQEKANQEAVSEEECLQGVIRIEAMEGIRYTVPMSLHPDGMEESITVRFRVQSVYQDSFLSVYYDDKRILHRKKRIMAPGEMEEVIVKRTDLIPESGNLQIQKIRIKIETE